MPLKHGRPKKKNNIIFEQALKGLTLELSDERDLLIKERNLMKESVDDLLVRVRLLEDICASLSREKLVLMQERDVLKRRLNSR